VVAVTGPTVMVAFSLLAGLFCVGPQAGCQIPDVLRILFMLAAEAEAVGVSILLMQKQKTHRR